MDPEFRVLRAALVPVEVVRKLARYSKHTNSWRFILHDNVWKISGVRDVTGELQKAAQDFYGFDNSN